MALLVLPDELATEEDTVLVLVGALVTPAAADDASDEVSTVVVEDDVIGTDGVEVELDSRLLLLVIVSRKSREERNLCNYILRIMRACSYVLRLTMWTVVCQCLRWMMS